MKQKRHYLKETERHTLKYDTANPKSIATDVHSLRNQRGLTADALPGIALHDIALYGKYVWRWSELGNKTRNLRSEF